MKIVRCESKDKLLKVVPKQYVDQARQVPDEAAPYSLVVLKDSVAHNPAIEKAISKCSTESKLVVAVENLSQEAAESLAKFGGYPLTIRDFYWTDERHKKILEFGGVKEKPREKNS